MRSRSRAASSKRRSTASRLQLRPQLGQRIVERLPFDALQGARRQLRPLAARQRPELGRLRRADDAVAAATEIEVAVGTHRARVRRRAQLADQAQLLQRRLELRPEHTPFDTLERGESRLDGRPLTIRAEVRAQPRTQVASTAHVEHLVVLVAEEIDAGPLRSAEREAALALDAARLGRRQLDEVADRPRAALLRHPDQPEQDLGRRLGVGQRPVAGPHVGREAVRERGEIRGLASEQPSREPDRVDDRRLHALVREPHRLVVEKRHVESRVVRDEHAVTREGEKPADDSGTRAERAAVARRVAR